MTKQLAVPDRQWRPDPEEPSSAGSI